MGMNSTPSSERIQIGIFGRRNAGKSSLINAMTGQELSIVSAVEGTTTDPVIKAMELLPLGPVVMIDTPGIDDEGELGALRVARSYAMLNRSDIALLVLDARVGMTGEDRALLERIKRKAIPCAIALNQCDLISDEQRAKVLAAVRDCAGEKLPVEAVSAKTGEKIYELKETIARLAEGQADEKPIVGDLLRKDKLTVLVIPIDKAAPKGRLILPQQQTIRDILEAGGASLVVRDTELEETLARLGDQVGLVITDSQAFARVSQIVPQTIPLTSFSILFARYKGELEPLLAGVRKLEELQDEDRVLISEGCTHHRQCGDIGTVKMPAWIQKYTGKKLEFDFTSGGTFPEDLSGYRLVVHCGGCMLNKKEMHYRLASAEDQHVPITNYGMVIAQVTGILKRSLEPLGL